MFPPVLISETAVPLFPAFSNIVSKELIEKMRPKKDTGGDWPSCSPDWVGNHVGGALLGVSVRVFSERDNRRGEPRAYVQHLPTGCSLGVNAKEQKEGGEFW